MLVIFSQKSGHCTFTWAGQLPCYAVSSWKRTPIRQPGKWSPHCLQIGFLILSTHMRQASLFGLFELQILWREKGKMSTTSWFCQSPHGFHLRQTRSAAKTRGLLMMHVATNRPAGLTLPKSLKYFCLEVQIHTYISQLTILHVARHRESKSSHVWFSMLHKNRAQHSWANIDRIQTVQLHNDTKHASNFFSYLGKFTCNIFVFSCCIFAQSFQ